MSQAAERQLRRADSQLIGCRSALRITITFRSDPARDTCAKPEMTAVDSDVPEAITNRTLPSLARYVEKTSEPTATRSAYLNMPCM